MISDKELEDILEQEADSLHSFRIERRSVIDMAKELQQHRSKKQVGVEMSDVELDRKAVSYLQDSEFVDAGQIITLTFHQAVQTYMDGYRACEQQGPSISVEDLKIVAGLKNVTPKEDDEALTRIDAILEKVGV